MKNTILKTFSSDANLGGFDEENKNSALLEENFVNGELVYDGKFLSIQRDRVRLPDGKETSREYLLHPGAVAIIPLFPDNCVLVEKQFRYPLKKIFIEYPAGKIDSQDHFEVNDIPEYKKKNQTCILSNGLLESNFVALRCAQRELKEETGFTADSWRFMTRIHPSVSYSNEFLDIFLAEGLHEGEQKLDEGEFIMTEKISLDRMLALVKDGGITDPKTIIATLWLSKWKF